MRWFRTYLLTAALVSLLAGCGGSRPVKPINPGLPTVVYAGPQVPSLLDVPPAQMPEALRAAYRLRPDARFLAAVAEVHRLVTGAPADTVTARWDGAGWNVECAHQQVGELRHLPDFPDAAALLGQWAARLLAAHPIAAGTPASTELAKAKTLIDQLDVPGVAQGMKLVDAGWATGRAGAWLPLAARGLTMLAVQVPRIETAADPLVARALAAATVAAVATPAAAVTEERALLAWRMGYATAAAALAESLPAGSPARLLAQRDSAGLHAAADAREATPLLRQLYLLRLAADGDEHRFEAWFAEHARAYGSGAIGAAVSLARFSTDGSIVPMVPVRLADELGRAEERPGLWDRTVEALARVLPEPLGRFLSWVTAMARGSLTPDWSLGAFEARLAGLDSTFAGPFLDGDVFATYFRGQMHAGFERSCIHYVDGLASVSASRKFSAAFLDAPPGLWRDAAQWCRHRSTLIHGPATADDLLGDLKAARGLSSEAVRRTVNDITSRIQYTDTRDVGAARAVFARLDSRPDQLERAGHTASNQLRDAPLAEALFARLLDVAAAEYPYVDEWYAAYRGDGRRLGAFARDLASDRGARFEALQRLLAVSRDTAGTLRAFDRLIAEDPDDWGVRDSYIDVLEGMGKPAVAARVAEDWLRHHDARRGFDYLFAATSLARQYQRQGRADAAWRLLVPLQGSYQQGVLQRSALVALDLGRAAEAESLARRDVRRYPASTHSRTTLAQVLWAGGRYAEAGRLLGDATNPISQEDWRDVVAPGFVHFFARRPLGTALSAYAGLTADRSDNTLSDLPETAADSGYYSLAIALEERRLASATDHASDLDMYRYYLAARGREEAVAWLKSRWSPYEARRQSLTVYRQGLYDLLWTLGVQPDEGEEGSYFWLVRALAWLQDPRHDAQRRGELLAFYRTPDVKYYQVAGRYLLGLEPKEDLLVRADTPHHRCEVAYYLGMKALSEGRYQEASDWLRVSVELYNGRDWEALWAKDLLARWVGTGRELAVAVPEVAAKPPRW